MKRMKSDFPDDERSNIEPTSGYDNIAVERIVGAGLDKGRFQDFFAYEEANRQFGHLSPEEQERVAENELSAGCLIKQLRLNSLDSASPVECDNVGCKANRPDFHTNQVALGSTCLTDARPTDTFNK